MPLKRHFLNWTTPALPAAAEYLIERYARADEFDLSAVIMVFPGRRAARRMLELLVQQSADRWPQLIPPRMVTFQKFPEMLYSQQFQLADDLTQLLVWKQALSSIDPKELAAALPGVPEEDAVSAWLALCETLRRQHNELAADGLEFDEVADALRQQGHDAESQRWMALRRIQSEYLMKMDDLGLWDRQAARLVAVQQQECRTDCDILLMGTVDMNRVVRQMLEQVADRVTALIHADPEEADRFDAFGCLLPAQWRQRQLDIPSEVIRIADSPQDQATWVIRELAAMNGQCRADDVTIGVADEDLVPVILQHLSDAGVSGRWPVGMQIRSTRPWQLLNAVMRHLASARDGQPPDFASLSDLIRHPDLERHIRRGAGVPSGHSATKKTSSTVDWLTQFDEYLAEHLPLVPGALPPKGSRGQTVTLICSTVQVLLRQLLPDVGDADTRPVQVSRSRSARPSSGRQRLLNLDSAVDSIDPQQVDVWNRRLPLLDWAEGCLRLLSWVYQAPLVAAEHQAAQGIAACLEQIQETVDTLRKIPPALMPDVSAVQALQLILKEVADEAIPPEPDAEAIDLTGWLDVALDDSPILILTGFNEGSVPESISSDVFLPDSFRSLMGLNDNARRYARDAYALSCVMHSRKRLTIISGRRDAQGNPLAPSRLWFAADPTSLPGRVRQFYGPDPVAPESAPAQSELTHSVPEAGEYQKGRSSRFIVPQPPLIATAPTEISVTAFRDYLACPYRYYLRRELGLTSVDDETRELTAPAFGSLMHDVLNRFGQSDVCHATSAEAIELVLLTELQKLATIRFGRIRSATVTVQLKMLENRLQEFARWQARNRSEGWEIVYTERTLKYADFRDIRDRSVVLSGRVDRIDRHRTSGQWRVLDYKTSEAAEKPESTHRQSDVWVDLQLPLYRLLVRSIGIEDQLQLGYIHLPGDLARIGCSIAEWDASDLDSAEHTAREVAADILDLRIDRVAPGDSQQRSEFWRVCQETIIDRSIPWLSDWKGRRHLS